MTQSNRINCLLVTALCLLAPLADATRGPMWPAQCPTATPYSDTPACLAKQKCEAPKVICCPASGKCSSSSTAAASSSTTQQQPQQSSSAPASSAATVSPSSGSPSVGYTSPSPSESSSASTVCIDVATSTIYYFTSTESSNGSASSVVYTESSSASSSSSGGEQSSSAASASSSSDSGNSGAPTSVSSSASEESSTASSPGASDSSSAASASESSPAASESSSASSASSSASESSSASTGAAASSQLSEASSSATSPSGSSASSGSPSSVTYPPCQYSSTGTPIPPSASSAAPSSASSAATYTPGSGASSAASTGSVQSTASTASVPSSTGVGSNEPCPCQLIIYLLEFMYSYLNSSQQIIFEQYCLARLRIILIDVTLTVEQQIVACGRVIREFCANYPDIGELLLFVELGDYGYCYDFAFVVAIAYEDDMAGAVCDVTDNSTGASNLTIAISNGTSQDQCGAGSGSVFNGFVSECNQINVRTIPRMNRARQLSWLYYALKYIYFVQYPDSEACVSNISVVAGDYNGTVGGFLDYCEFYQIETSIVTSVLVDVSSTGECPFVTSCQSGVNSANSTGQYNSSVIAEAQQFVDYCRTQFASQPDAYQRHQIVLAAFVSLSLDCRVLLKKIKITGASANCRTADVIAVGNACENGYACQNITFGGPGEDEDETCERDTFNRTSIVIASQNYMNSLNTTGQRAAYRSYHNSIVNCCYSSQYGTNLTARMECVALYVTNYSNNNAALRALYLAVKLTTVIIVKVNTVISAAYSTFGCFCGCTSC